MLKDPHSQAWSICFMDCLPSRTIVNRMLVTLGTTSRFRLLQGLFVGKWTLGRSILQLVLIPRNPENLYEDRIRLEQCNT